MAKKPQKRTLQTRKKILRTARSLVQEFGFDGVSTDVITRESGVAKGTLFAHFGDRNGLMSCLLDERLAAMLDEWQKSSLASDKGMVVLLKRSMAFINLMASDRGVFSLFLQNSGVTSPNTSPKFYETLTRLTNLLTDHLEQWSNDKTASERLRVDLTPTELGDGLIAFMIQAASRHLCGEIPDRENVKAMLEKQFRAWLLGCN